MFKLSLGARLGLAAFIVAGLAAMYFIASRSLPASPLGVEKEAVTALIQAPADGSLAIDVEGFVFTPFGTMVIKGAGFDPSAATAVVFTTSTKQRLTVPVSKVTATELTVPVPPLKYDDVKGAFVPDQASLMVVQIKLEGDRLKVRSSNKSHDFMISAPARPAAVVKAEGGALPKGSIAQAVMAVAVEKLKSAAGKVPEGNPELVAALAKAQKGMEELLVGIEKIKNNPQATVKLATTDGAFVTLGADDVAKIDLIFGGYLGQREERQSARFGEQTTGLVAPAQAATPGECVERVMANSNIDSRLGSVVESLCGVTGSLAQTGDPGWVNEPYLIQAILTLQLAAASENWNIPLKVASAAALTMYFDAAIEGKLPDAGFLKGLLLALGEEVGDKALERLYGDRMPFLANLHTAIDVWDLGCKAFKWTGCLSSHEIAVGTGDIIMDIGDGIAYWLRPYVIAIIGPDQPGAVDLGPGGIKKGGYDEWLGPNVTPEPYLPEPFTTPSGPSPKPIVPADLTPEPSPAPAPAPKPKPAPLPPPPSCYELKEATSKQCQADCPEAQSQEEYDACTSSCESSTNLLSKSDCINNCIGARSKAYSARSRCISSCLNASYATKCP